MVSIIYRIVVLLVFFVNVSKLCKLGILIHQQLNILANDCDLSDKLFHAHHSDDCAQSDKLNNTNR